MTKDFDVKTFVEEYEKVHNSPVKDDEAKFIKTKLKTEKYLPYQDKATAAENIIDSSSYALTKGEDGVLRKTDVISFTSPMRYVLFVMTVIDKYTNIEVNFKDIMPEFDALNRNGLIEIIFNKVGDKEVNEFNTVVEMVLNDFMTNKYQFRNYINELVYKFADMVEKCSPLIDNVINKLENLTEDDEKQLSGFLDRIMKRMK